ncbi:MAG TPA: type II toxin-antitoxin system RelE/ParE family toxin [Pirellulales bacterium]
MPRVERSNPAENDLFSIAEYIARDNPSAAAQWLDEIEKKFNLLATQPLMGEAVDQIRKGLRRFTHGAYLIFYEPLPNGIALIRILHGARQIDNLL